MKTVGNLMPFVAQNWPELNKWPDSIFLVDLSKKSDIGSLTGSRCIGAIREDSAKSVIEKALATGVRHLVQVSGPCFQDEVDISARLIHSPDTFFLDPVKAIFSMGIEKISKSDHIERFNFPVKGSSEKRTILNELDHRLSEIPGSRTIRDSITSIADELFTNAVFNAPTESSGKRRNSHLKRNSNVKLKDSESAELFISHNTQKILIGCMDSFGSLRPEELLLRLYECYSNGTTSSIDMGHAGAGIGFQMMFDLCMSIFIGVSPGKKTVICCLLPLGLSARESEVMSKNLHVITVG